MAMNVRDVVEHLYRYLRKEQRQLPLTDPDLDDPLPEALAAVNAVLQRLAVRAPKFAVQRPMAALFHGPATVTVSGLVREGRTVSCVAWPAWAAGCQVMLPGDALPNRILEVTGQVATLLYPHLAESTGGQAKVMADGVVLGPEVIAVLPPVRLRGGAELRPVNGKRALRAQGGGVVRDDFGRLRRGPAEVGGTYHVESVMLPGMSLPRFQLRLGTAVTAETVVEYDARCSLGWVTANHVFNDAPVPVPAEHVESLFLPLVLQRFFSASVMRNADVPPLVAVQAQEAELLLEAMRPQTEKTFRLYPGL